MGGFRRAAGGYSLVEAILSLSVASVILLAASSALVTGLRFYKIDQVRLQRQAAVRNAMDRISRDLREGVGVVVGAGGTRVDFTQGGVATRYYLSGTDVVRRRGTTDQRIAGPVTTLSFTLEASGSIVVEMASTAPQEGSFGLTSRVLPRVR